MNAVASDNRRSKSISRIALLIGGTGLGAALLVLLLRSVKLDQLGSDFSRVDFKYLALAIAPFMINLLIKVPRWSLLFGEDAPRWKTLFGSMNVGYAVNSLMPLRLGEVVRAYWIRDHTGISMMKTLSTIALERVTDGVTLFILLMVMLPTVAFPKKLLVPALIFGAIFVLVLGLMVALAIAANKADHPLANLMRRLESGRWEAGGKAVSQIVSGLHALRSKRALFLLASYTLVIWGTNSLLIWLVLRAFHIAVPFSAGILLTAVLNLGMAVPSSPGYVGVFDYLMVLTLGLYGVNRTPALAASLGFHAIAFIPVTIIGVVYLTHSGVRGTLKMLRAGATR